MSNFDLKIRACGETFYINVDVDFGGHSHEVVSFTILDGHGNEIDDTHEAYDVCVDKLYSHPYEIRSEDYWDGIYAENYLNFS